MCMKLFINNGEAGEQYTSASSPQVVEQRAGPASLWALNELQRGDQKEKKQVFSLKTKTQGQRTGERQELIHSEHGAACVNNAPHVHSTNLFRP